MSRCETCRKDFTGVSGQGFCSAKCRTMRLVPLTGEENRVRLLAIAAQNTGVDDRAMRQRELDDVSRGTSRGVCAFQGTTPVGYAVYRHTVQTYHLDTIVVDKPRQRAGVGSALLEWICADLKRTGPTVLNVVTDASAHSVLRFYLDRGFALAGSVNDELRPGVTQVHLTREIR